MPTPGLTDHGHQPAALRDVGVGKRLFQDRQLAVAADERRLLALALGALDESDKPIRRDPLGLALQLERLDLLDVDEVAHELIRQPADQDLVCGSGLLQAGCRVDGVAGHEPLPGGRVAGDHLAGVDPGPIRELHAVPRQEVLVELAERLLHAMRGADRPERVVLVQLRQAEDGHDRVADVLLDRPAVEVEDRLHRVEVAGHDLAERFGIERLAEVRRALEVREDDRDGLAHLLRRQGRGQRRPAEPAQPELGRVLLAAVRTDDQLHAYRV